MAPLTAFHNGAVWEKPDAGAAHRCSASPRCRRAARSPVDHAVAVQEPQRQRHLGRVEARARLVKLARALDLEHQVAAGDVLHDEKQPILRAVEVRTRARGHRGITGGQGLDKQRTHLDILWMSKLVPKPSSI